MVDAGLSHSHSGARMRVAEALELPVRHHLLTYPTCGYTSIFTSAERMGKWEMASACNVVAVLDGLLWLVETIRSWLQPHPLFQPPITIGSKLETRRWASHRGGVVRNVHMTTAFRKILSTATKPRYMKDLTHLLVQGLVGHKMLLKGWND